MIVAFAIWGNRIAPVFDVAQNILLVEVEGGRILKETQESLDEMTTQKALRLAELKVGTLVCGAISRPTQVMVAAYGIQVIPFVAGELGEIIQAWLSKGLKRDTYAMPGCCRRGLRRWLEMNDLNKEKYLMNGKKHGGMGHGGGMGGGGGQGQGRGRRGDSNAGGGIGACLCLKCGHREPHERGIPCAQQQCPKCGTAMTRE